jgi:hypothetical protein
MVNKKFNASFTTSQLRGHCSYKGLTLGGSLTRDWLKSLPLYSEYTSPANKYIIIKTGKGRNGWEYKHIWEWEKINGKIPKDHCLIFLDGNRQNTNIENLYLVSLPVRAALNKLGMRYNNPELTKTAIALMQLQKETYKKFQNLLGLDKKEFKHYITCYKKGLTEVLK